MTITLDIKEILEYEKAMKSWGTTRAMNIEKMLNDYNSPSHMRPHGDEGIRRAIVSWDRDNPPPTLIPKI